MLKALLHGKAGRIEHNGRDSISWRELFRQREDLMSAAFFGRFAYLSPELQNVLLRDWFQSKDDFTDFERVEFWPRYLLREHGETRSVEPDLLMRFGTFNLLVEIKPPQGGDQYYQQWLREIAAFLQSDEQADLPLYFLAVGRIEKRDAECWGQALLEGFPALRAVGAIKWQPVVDSLLRVGSQVEVGVQDQRVLDDMLETLKLYGLKCGIGDWNDLFTTQLHQTLASQGLGGLAGSFHGWQPAMDGVDSEIDWTVLKRFGAQQPEICMDYMEQWTL